MDMLNPFLFNNTAACISRFRNRKRDTDLQGFIFISGTKHLIHQKLTLIRTTKSQALLHHIRSKFLLTHLYNLSCKLANNSRPFMWFTMFKDVLSKKKYKYQVHMTNGCNIVVKW